MLPYDLPADLVRERSVEGLYPARLQRENSGKKLIRLHAELGELTGEKVGTEHREIVNPLQLRRVRRVGERRIGRV